MKNLIFLAFTIFLSANLFSQTKVETKVENDSLIEITTVTKVTEKHFSVDEVNAELTDIAITIKRKKEQLERLYNHQTKWDSRAKQLAPTMPDSLTIQEATTRALNKQLYYFRHKNTLYKTTNK